MCRRLSKLRGYFLRSVMKMTLTRLLIISCFLAASILNSIAQEKKPRPYEPRPEKIGQAELKVPTDGTFKILGPKFALGKVVKGAPYSATATTETNPNAQRRQSDYSQE